MGINEIQEKCLEHLGLTATQLGLEIVDFDCGDKFNALRVYDKRVFHQTAQRVEVDRLKTNAGLYYQIRIPDGESDVEWTVALYPRRESVKIFKKSEYWSQYSYE